MADEMSEEQVHAAFDEACPGARVDAASPLNKGHASAHWRFDTDEGPLLLKVPVRNSSPEHFRHLIVATRRAAEAGLPVARFRSFLPHSEALGKPVLVLEQVAGEQASDVWKSLGDSEKERAAWEMGELVGRLHTVASSSLTDALGRSAQASAHQDALSSLDEALSDIGDVTVPAGWEVTSQRLRARLECLRDIRPVLTHRDFYLDNVMLDGAKVSAVLDFEHARFADQYSEFGKISELLFDWYPETRDPFLAGYRQWHDLDESAAARIHAHSGLYNVVMCAYFSKWQPNLVSEYVTRIEQWLDEDARFD